MSAHVKTQTDTPAKRKSKETMKTKLLHNLPSALCLLAAALILVSIAFPYWRMVLHAPQYPLGLEMRVFVNRMTGDEDPVMDEVKEIDGLNHYIGMESLYNAAKIERAIALPAVALMIILIVAAVFWKSRWSWLLTVPALGFPFIFLADLAYWLNHHGQNLDPLAPLSSAIKPFTPPILGEGVIGNFVTTASLGTGWFMAAAAAALIVAAMMIQLTIERSNGDVPAAS